MKRFISALSLCTSLLVLLGFILFPHAEAAKEDPIKLLLEQPAPPPPNPLVKLLGRTDEKFFNKSKPPADNASIEDLMDYWSYQSTRFNTLSYSPKMSDAAMERVLAEISKEPEKLTNFLNSLPDGKRSADFVKELYDREGKDGVYEQGDRATIKQWLTHHSTYFTADLARLAEQVREDNEYVTNHEDLLSLTSVDYARAKPIIDRLYSNSSQKVPQVLAKWARYRNALETNSTSDIETYRSELKAVVEDKSATAGMRDLALDALSREKDWTGRDDWYFSLLGDETLADLRVNGQSFTGLTTMLLMTPEEKYVQKMLELLKSDNATIRSAAVRNLALRMNTDNLDVLRAFVPWLEDPKWATDYNNARMSYINQLSEYELPESVPGLIKVLDEKVAMRYGANAPAANAVYPATTANANVARSYANSVALSYDSERTAYRMSAVGALTKQKSPQAASALRRILSEVDIYERAIVVKAVLASNGFSIQEQLDGLEAAAKDVRVQMDMESLPPETLANMAANSANLVANAAAYAAAANAMRGAWADPRGSLKRPMTPAELKVMIGEQLTRSEDISDELAVAVVDRIESIDAKEPKLAAAYRRMILNWKNSAINLLFLRDLKRRIADTDTMIRLISERRSLREKHQNDLTDLRAGKGAPSGFTACLFEDRSDAEAVIDGEDGDARIGLYACSRMIRLPLPVAKVSRDLKSTNQLLKIAAERYLESEDSAEARSFVLSVHPNEIKILGARNSFLVGDNVDNASQYLYALFQSIGNNTLYYGWYASRNDEDLVKAEKTLVAEMKKDTELVNVYSYDKNYIRVYKDRAIFSWDEDESRYRERPLEKSEFEAFTNFLQQHDADSLPPFIACGGEYCSSKEFVMIGRSGGRRIYFNGSGEFDQKRGGPEFPAGLNDYFAQLKRRPATLKYALSREIPGLEIVFASDELRAESVWKGEGDDLRIVGSRVDIRKKVKSDLEDLEENEITPGDMEAYLAGERKKAELIKKRRYEGFDWYKVVSGGLEPGAAQPPQVEFIPVRDGLAVPPSNEQWKARAADIEVRANETGLYKLVRGKLTKIKSGDYNSPVISADGRFALVRKLAERGGNTLVRVDLVTNREYPLAVDDASFYVPKALVRSLGRVLISADYSDYDEFSDEEGEPMVTGFDDEQSLLVDLATGTTHPVPAGIGPLAQQTFRPLQQSAKPNELWAAIPNPDKNETTVGTFNLRTFTFTPIRQIPKIRFNSMNLWVDEPANKFYFTYRGHVLAMPLNK